LCVLNSAYRKKIESFAGNAERMAIVGLGNEYRTDDGAGTATVRLLKDSPINKSGNVALFDAGRDLIGHLSDIEDFQPSRIIIVDAADLGIKAGEIMMLDEKQIVENRISTHENNLDLAMAHLKITLPEHQVLFIGIQFESLEMSDKLALTADVKKAAEELVKLITDAVTKS